MKVLITTDTVGGVWNFTLALAQASPFEVHIATMGRKLSAAQRLEIADFPFYESEFPLEWMANPWRGVDQAGAWLLGLARTVKPDLIHHNTLPLAHLPFPFPSVVTVHSCVWSWWEAVKNERAPAEWDEYRRRVTRSLRAADKVVAPSLTMLAAVEQWYGVKGKIIPNFAKRGVAECAKEPFIFAAGRVWDEAKNLRALSNLMPRLSWPVHIAGEGSELGHLDRREMDQWYSRASIYAWPAKYEPFGLSVLEAAQHGCALVLGDIASLRENWNGAAHFVSSENELERAIEGLIADSESRVRWGQLARERAGQFSKEVTIKGYSAVYEQVLSGALCAL